MLLGNKLCLSDLESHASTVLRSLEAVQAILLMEPLSYRPGLDPGDMWGQSLNPSDFSGSASTPTLLSPVMIHIYQTDPVVTTDSQVQGQRITPPTVFVFSKSIVSPILVTHFQ